MMGAAFDTSDAIPSGNINAPSIMIGERAADLIAADHVVRVAAERSRAAKLLARLRVTTNASAVRKMKRRACSALR